MKFRTILLFGAPGAGKGTQGKILGSIPGFNHCACGDIFRSLEPHTPLGQTFLEYSSRGELVPDNITFQLWWEHIDKMLSSGRFNPERDILVLDGIPRNIDQAKTLQEKLEVLRLFHLTCPDRDKLIGRLKRRALHENRMDDANESVIRARLETYDNQSRPVIDFYGPPTVCHIDSMQQPYCVLRDILTGIP